MILGWVHGLGQIVVFWPGRLRVLSAMILCSVQVFLILLFRNCQVTSDPAWHLRSVGLLSFLLGIDTEPPCCIWPGRLRVLSTMIFSSFQVSPIRLFRNCQVTSILLAPQIGRFDVENLDSKNPEIYHDFLQFSGKNPGSYHVFRTFPGANPEFCHVFLPFTGKNSQICHVLRLFQVRILEFSMIFRSRLVLWDCR